MRRKHEVINGHKISVWDSKGVIDRYTIVYLDNIYPNGNVEYFGMSDKPQYFANHGEMKIWDVQYKGRGGCFDKRIKFADLPADCQKAVLQDLEMDEREAQNG
jgi:hypothetical protein